MWIINKIGMKSIKIASAVTMSLLIGNLLKFSSPYLIALTSVIGIQGTKDGSVSSAKDRVTGTLIGVILGSMTMNFLSNDLIITVIGVFLIIYVCNLLKLKDSIVQANIVYLSIMLFPTPSFSAVSVTISIVIGVLVAIIINFILSPFEIIYNLRSSYNELMLCIFSLCSKILTNSKDLELQAFNSNVMIFKSLLKAYRNEYIKLKDKELNMNEVDILYEHIDGIRFFIYTISELNSTNLSKDNVNKANSLMKINIIASDNKEINNDDLFNFHVDKLLGYLEKIGEIK